MKNVEHCVVECSFGPIGRSGGRAPIPGFARRMEDFDGRSLEVSAFYGRRYRDPELNSHAKEDPFYWNFLEMEFDPRGANPRMEFRARNLIDAPDETPRGGGVLALAASETGRRPSCSLPETRTLPNADVRFSRSDGRPIRAVRSLPGGEVPLKGLIDVPVGVKIVMTAFDGERWTPG